MTLNLRGRHDLGSIIGGAYRLYTSNFRTLFLIALITVPVQMLIVVVQRTFSDVSGLDYLSLTQNSLLGNDSSLSAGETLLLNALVVPATLIGMVAQAALIFAAHGLAGGEPQTPGESIDEGFRRFADVLTTWLLSTVLTAASLFAAPLLGIWWLLRRDATIDGRRDWWLALIPGVLTVYLIVRWMLSRQAIVIEDTRRWSALDRSADAVRGSWWRTLGIIIVIGIIGALPGFVAAFGAFAAPLAHAAATSVAAALALPFVVAAETLLFYDLRAKRSTDADPA